FIAMEWAAFRKLDNPTKTPAETTASVDILKSALRLLTRSLAEDERNRDHERFCFELAERVYNAFREYDKCDRPTAFARVDAAFAADPKPNAARLKLQGEHLIQMAWEARGSGRASTITSQGLKLFSGRLRDGRAVLEQAWTLAPDDYRVAMLML